MRVCYILPLLALLLTSCSVFKSDNTRDGGVILETEPQPVEINRAAIPQYGEKKPLIKKEESATATETIKEPKRKFAFRTPNLIDDLPSDSELENKTSYEKNVDETVDEATTIRASQ